jgi:hypothetical protein
MKNIPALFLFLLFCHSGFSQQHKPTGGAYYSLSIIGIDSAIHDSCLLNAKLYFVDVILRDLGPDLCGGDITAKLGNREVGRLKNCITGEYKIPIEFSVSPGNYTLTCEFPCGAYWDGKVYHQPIGAKHITVIEPKRLIEPGRIQEDNVYPLPASQYANINVSGLSLIQSIWVTDIQGRKMNLTNMWQDKSIITIPVDNFPAGVYFIHLFTEQGNISKKMAVTSQQ